MARKSSSRGFAVPLMVVGSVLVGLLALIGVKNILQKGSIPAVIASQTVQGNGSVQTIAASAPIPTQIPNVTPTPETSGCDSQTFKIDPCLVDTSTPKVTVVFKLANIIPLQTAVNITPFPQKGFGYYICLKSSVSDCSGNDWLGPANFLNATSAGYTGNVLIIPVCGNGANALKLICANNGSDWFHAGKVYNVFLAQGLSNNLTPSDVIATASFYVTHFYPKIVLPKNPSIDYNLNMAKIGNGGTTIPVILQGRNIQAGINDSDSNTFNDYSVRVIGVDNEYQSSATGCIYIPRNSNPKANPTGNPSLDQGGTYIQLPNVLADSSNNLVYLTAGQYVIQIKDGKGGNGGSIGTTPGKETCTEGDFTLWDIPFTIGENEKDNGSFGSEIHDPKQQETAPNLSPPPPPAPICFSKDANGYCTSVPTALGFTIHTEPASFVGDIFAIVLAIGGIAAFVLLIQAGYSLMTSAGNKEKVGAAREQITAAIMGLLFIILSITILEFIGINILHIPGFK